MIHTNLRVFSGIQPSGNLHIGNYLGAIKQWIPLQDSHDCLFCIVDLHAITVKYDPTELQDKIFSAALDYLAAGLDPKKATLFVQSQVPEHTELMWLLNTITPIGELERMTQFKEKTEKSGLLAGLLNYPVLMAADILLYNTNIVPVGEDQQQHVELTRVIARKFNTSFGQTFVEPKSQLSESKRIMSLAEPTKKMSKSAGAKHYVSLTDTPQLIREKISKAVTDTGGDAGGEMTPGVKNLFLLLKEFGTTDELKRFEKSYADNTIRYSELKSTLAEAIITTLTPFQEQRAALAKQPKRIWKILDEGAKRARPIAQKTLRTAKQQMGLF